MINPVSPITADSRIPAAALGAVALLIALWTLYPGWYSFDAAWQLAQARTHAFSDLQPPLMALLWSGLLTLGLAPGALLVLHLCAFAVGFYCVSRALRTQYAMVVSLLMLWVPFLVLFGHLWIDVSLAAALTLGTGGLAATGPTVRSRILWLSLIPLVYAAGVRHNAFPALLPLLFLLLARARGGPQSRRLRLLGALLVAGFAMGGSLMVSRLVVERLVPSWTPTAIWDLCAVSVATDTLLLPTGMYGPGLSVDELRPLLNSDTVMTVLTSTRGGINTGTGEPLPDAVLHELRQRWLALPLTHTRHWLAHRAAVAWSLFGPQHNAKDQNLVIVPQIVVHQGNPALELNQTAANGLLLRTVHAMRGSPLMAPLTYLLLSLLALGLSARPSFAGDRSLVQAVVASAWLYALPLPLIVPSAEWRYTLWPMLASALAFVLAVSPRGLPPGNGVTGETPSS